MGSDENFMVRNSYSSPNQDTNYIRQRVAGSDKRYLSDKITSLYIRGAQIFRKKKIIQQQPKVSGARRMTRSKLHTEEPQILGASIHNLGRSQCPRGLKRWSTAARLLRSWVRIPGGMDVCLL